MIEIFVAIFAGFLPSLLAPKLSLFWLAWLVLVPFLVLIYRSSSPKKAAWLGFIIGLVFYGLMFAFTFTLNEWVGPIIIAGWLFLTVWYSLYFALYAYLLKKFSFSRWRLIAAALLWVIIEWLRTLTPFGFAVNLGYSQWAWTSMLQLASITGVLGLSFLIVFANAIVAEFFFRLFSWREKLFSLVGFLILLSLVNSYGLWQLNRPDLDSLPDFKFALIQGNFPQRMKLNPTYIDEMKQTYWRLTKASSTFEPDLVVWPESAIVFYIQNEPAYLNKVKKLAAQKRFNILMGLPRLDDDSLPYNSSLLIDWQGRVLGWQDKKKLVPFGEYIPLRPLLVPILSRFSGLKSLGVLQREYQPGSLPDPITTPLGKIGVGICSDSFFPEVFRLLAQKGANYFFVLTNDAWFKQSSAAYKHVVVDIFRAVENRRYLVQVANTGISVVIDPWGRVVEQSRLDKQEIILAKAHQLSELTFYSRFGNWFAYFCLLALLIIWFYLTGFGVMFNQNRTQNH